MQRSSNWANKRTSSWSLCWTYMKITYVAHTWLSYISSYYSPLGRFIWIQHCDQLPVSLLAQLVERCNGIAEVGGHALSKIGWFKRSIHHDLNTSFSNIDCNLYRGRLYEEKSGRDQYDMTNTILTVIFIATMSNYNTLSIKEKKGQKLIPDDKDSKGLTSKKYVLKGSFSSLNSLLSKRMDFWGRNRQKSVLYDRQHCFYD